MDSNHDVAHHLLLRLTFFLGLL